MTDACIHLVHLINNTSMYFAESKKCLAPPNFKTILTPMLVTDSLSSSLDLNDHTLIQIASLLKSERPFISIKKI